MLLYNEVNSKYKINNYFQYVCFINTSSYLRVSSLSLVTVSLNFCIILFIYLKLLIIASCALPPLEIHS